MSSFLAEDTEFTLIIWISISKTGACVNISVIEIKALILPLMLTVRDTVSIAGACCKGFCIKWRNKARVCSLMAFQLLQNHSTKSYCHSLWRIGFSSLNTYSNFYGFKLSNIFGNCSNDFPSKITTPVTKPRSFSSSSDNIVPKVSKRSSLMTCILLL